MLDWTIETKHGCFQGNSLEETIKDMIEFYGENDQDPEIIKDIYCFDSGEILQQVSETEIHKIQRRVEREVRNWREQEELEFLGQRQIRNEYRANLI